VLCAAPASALEALSVGGGESARTLDLHLCHEIHAQVSAPVLFEHEDCLRGHHPELVGSLPLALSNTSHRRERIQVLYVREGGSVARLPAISSFVYLAGDSSPRTPRHSIVVPPRATRVLRLRFRLQPGEPYAALDGMLDIRVLGPSRQLIAVPVTTRVPTPTGLRLEPSKLTLSIDRGSRPSVTLTLVGPGAGVLADALDTRSELALRNTTQGEVKLTLGDFRPAGAGVAHAQLSVTSTPEPGAYTGELTLFSLSPGAPRLNVTVDAHRSIAWTLVLVAIGVLLGNAVPLGYRRNSARNTLLAALKEVRAQYQAADRALPPAARDAMWGLNDLAETRPTPAKEPTAIAVSAELPSSRRTGRRRTRPLEPPGVSMLEARIEKARNDSELEEDTGAVIEVIARLQRWLRLAPAVWKLVKTVSEVTPQGDLSGWWSATNTWRETRLLQERLLREPESSTAADDLVARVLWQIVWYKRFAKLHQLAVDHDAQVDIVHEAQGPIDGQAWLDRLKRLDRKLSGKVLERSAAERDELLFQVERLGEEFGVSFRQNSFRALDDRLTNEPRLRVQWQSSPNLFTGWATIDGTSLRSLRAQAASRGHAPTPPALRTTDGLRSLPSWLRSLPGRLRRYRRDATFRLRFWVAFVIPLLAATVFYSVTIYTQTWGSLTDMLTALTAGLVGRVAIDQRTLLSLPNLFGAGGRQPAPTTPAKPSPAAPPAAAGPPAGGAAAQ
jgi:hypothetical protein